MMHRSITTISVDLARRVFATATGEGIVWAVVDSGINGRHPHFRRYANLQLPIGLTHRAFGGLGNPLVDEYAHGTHLAGIVAGEVISGESRILLKRHAAHAVSSEELLAIAGMAPRCKLLSLKVLGASGSGDDTSIIAALDAVQEMNDTRGPLRVHGVLIAIGGDYDVAATLPLSHAV
jgi:serine protease AprX